MFRVSFEVSFEIKRHNLQPEKASSEGFHQGGHKQWLFQQEKTHNED